MSVEILEDAMKRRRSGGMVLLAATLVISHPVEVSAQWREAPLVQGGSSPSAASLPVLQPERHPGDRVAACEPSRTVRVAGGALGGAAVGWLIYRVTAGILAGGESDDVTRRLRTRFVLGGAVAGAVLGALPRAPGRGCDAYPTAGVPDTTAWS